LTACALVVVLIKGEPIALELLTEPRKCYANMITITKWSLVACVVP